MSFNELILSSRRVLIVCHKYPDFDAIGSCLGLWTLLQEQGIEAKIWISEKIGPIYSLLPQHQQICRHIPKDFEFDTLFVLDCSDFSRVGDYEQLEKRSHPFRVVNIDHHKDNTEFGDYNFVADISSVGEYLTSLFTSNGWEINADMATSLYAAISYDTGRFSHSNVTAQTFDAAATLVRAGANANEINLAMENTKTKADFDVLFDAINNMTMNESLKYVYTVLPERETETTIKIIDILQWFRDAEIFLVFRQPKEGVVKISLRSRRDFDVSHFSNQFGGGGHAKASGIEMKGDLKDVIQTVTSRLEQALKRDNG